MDLRSLNPPQQQAVMTTEGPVLVLSGAGTGKTTVITYRIARLIEIGVAPEAIMGVTFTNKAAREMKARVCTMLPQVKPDRLTLTTFHSLGARVLRAHIRKLGYDPRFGIADMEDQEGVLRQAIGDCGLAENPEYKPSFFRNQISHAKNELRFPADVRAQKYMHGKDKVADVYERYQEILCEINLVDFDDLLLLVVRLWREFPEILKSYQERYHYLLVDEYQDTNVVQAELLRLLAGERRNICVVGDDDQSIYGWRGAHVGNILEFGKKYPGAVTIKLEQNYRSTNTILDAANGVISNNRDRHSKSLWSTHPMGDTIKVLSCPDEHHEADNIAEILRHTYHEMRVPYSEMAVLMRANHQAEALELAFRKWHVPYRLVDATSFYERREIKDAAAYLRLLLNPRDDISLLRILNVPPRGLGGKAIDVLKEMRGSSKQAMWTLLTTEAYRTAIGPKAVAGVDALLAAFDESRFAMNACTDLTGWLHTHLKAVGYLDGMARIYKDHEDSLTRQARVLEFIESADSVPTTGAWEDDLQAFLEANALTDDHGRKSKREDQVDRVTILTVHSAKGLEWPVVVVVGLEQKLFPHQRALDEGSIDEERRLFYVAVTRAKKQLYLSWAKRRRGGGAPSMDMRKKSQFLDELPGNLQQPGTPDVLFRPASEEETEATFAEMRAKLNS